MKIQFSGAAGCVTGSSHLLNINGKNVLLDCGLYQGRDQKERGNNEFPFVPSQIDYLILSHAHIDHSGRIPMLYKNGFNGKIICTPPTKDLCDAMLQDSGKIQEQDAERENRKRGRQGKKPIEPLYTIEDAIQVLNLFETVDYNVVTDIFDGLKLKFIDSGHMLGAAYVLLDIKEDGKDPIKFAYSGDVGNHNIPLMNEPGKIEEADILLLESTYGNRVHEPQNNENEKLISIINSTVKNGGNVIIPSFAVGRAQEIIYILNEYAEKNLLDEKVRVYIDSPLASKATAVFQKYQNYMDEEAQKYIKSGDDIFKFKNLFIVEDVEESKKLNMEKEGCVIISASGMADAGRVRHHLKHNLWRKECSVVFVGYQAEGTLGKILIDGIKNVTIVGENVQVEAKIYQMNGLSGHADRNGLLDVVKGMDKKPKKICLVHGDAGARASLGKTLEEKGYNIMLADNGEELIIDSLNDLNTLTEVIEGPIEILHKKQANEGVLEEIKDKDAKVSDISNDRKRLIEILGIESINNLSDEELLGKIKGILGR